MYLMELLMVIFVQLVLMFGGVGAILIVCATVILSALLIAWFINWFVNDTFGAGSTATRRQREKARQLKAESKSK